MAYHDEAFDCRRRRAIDGHGLRERPHGNHPGRIRRGVLQGEVGWLAIRAADGHRHMAKACLGGLRGRVQQRDTGRCQYKWKDTKTMSGSGKHGGQPLVLAGAAGRDKRSIRVRWRGVADRATKCRSGGTRCKQRARTVKQCCFLQTWLWSWQSNDSLVVPGASSQVLHLPAVSMTTMCSGLPFPPSGQRLLACQFLAGLQSTRVGWLGVLRFRFPIC